MKLDDFFPLIIIALIVLVSLLKALFKAFSSAQKSPTPHGRPSVWDEFKKALKDLSQEQAGRRRAAPGEHEDEEGDLVLEEEEPPPPVVVEQERPGGERQVIVVTQARRPRRRMAEPAPQPVPQVAAAPPRPHRPEDLGSGIAEEVKDITHRPVQDHPRERGLAGRPAVLVPHQAIPPALSLLHLIGANQTELQRAILMQEILSLPLADRQAGPLWIK